MPQANERKGREETANRDGNKRMKDREIKKKEKRKNRRDLKAAERARKTADQEAEKVRKERERAERQERRLKGYSKTLLKLERKEANVKKTTCVLNENDEVIPWTLVSTLTNAVYVWVCILKTWTQTGNG